MGVRLGSHVKRQDYRFLDPDESYMTIKPANDECDDTDVNLPLPVCQGIRRVCRNYKANRQYGDYEDENDEDDRYLFHVQYA